MVILFKINLILKRSTVDFLLVGDVDATLVYMFIRFKLPIFILICLKTKFIRIKCLFLIY